MRLRATTSHSCPTSFHVIFQTRLARRPLPAGFTPGPVVIFHSTPPATQRASLSRSGELTVASFIKIIDSGHQDSQYLATLTFDATAGAAQDECPASPSPTVVGWMATRMAATPTTVARWMPVPIAVPLAAVGAREEVAPHCVTDLGDYACCHVATRAIARMRKVLSEECRSRRITELGVKRAFCDISDLGTSVCHVRMVSRHDQPAHIVMS